MSLAEKHFAGLPSSSKSFDVSRCKYTGSEVRMLHLECNGVTRYLYLRLQSVMMTCHMPTLQLLLRYDYVCQ